MKGIKITAMLLIICQTVIAQQKTAEEVTKNRMDRLESVIELSEDQKSSIETVVFESSQKIIELKKSGSADKEEIAAIKKAERAEVKKLLSESQIATLKEARKGMKAERKEAKADRAKRKEAKDALLVLRQDFDRVLSSEEKEAVEKARALMPEKLNKEDRANLSEEEKAQRKTTKKEIANLLKPLIENHKSELDAIKADMPARPEKANKLPKEKKKNGEQRFYHRFLLMK